LIREDVGRNNEDAVVEGHGCRKASWLYEYKATLLSRPQPRAMS
jgi:hypothetical protein